MLSSPHRGAGPSDLGAFPPKQGMYNPAFEKDACGLAMVATLRGEPGHDIIALALTALRNLEHRGAIGSDSGTGDGAGILTQMPDAFLRAVVEFELPPVGEYAAGMAFLPHDADERAALKAGVERIAESENLVILIVQKRRHPGLEPSPYVPGREWTPSGAVQSQDTDDFVDVSEPPTDDVAEGTATSTLAAK